MKNLIVQAKDKNGWFVIVSNHKPADLSSPKMKKWNC